MGKRVESMPMSSEHQWDEVVQTYLYFKEAVHCSPRTIQDYRETLRYFHDHWKPDLNDHRSLERSVLNHLGRYKNPYTYNRNRAYLRAFFNWCINEGIIDGKNPVEGIPPRETSSRIRHLDEDTVRGLLKQPNKRTYDGFRDYTMMLVMLDCGIRPGELLQITPENVETQWGAIRIPVFCNPFFPKVANHFSIALLLRGLSTTMPIASEQNLDHQVFIRVLRFLEEHLVRF